MFTLLQYCGPMDSALIRSTSNLSILPPIAVVELTTAHTAGAEPGFGSRV